METKCFSNLPNSHPSHFLLFHFRSVVIATSLMETRLKWIVTKLVWFGRVFAGMISPRWTHDISVTNHDIPPCPEHPPMYLWISPSVLMNIPLCAYEYPQIYSWISLKPSWISPDLFVNIHLCAYEYPPMYSWTSPLCTYEYPRMYIWTSPDVLTSLPPPMYWWYPHTWVMIS